MAAYEQLRGRVLAGKVFSSHFGLILLLREGLAAWISRCLPLPLEAAAEPRATAPNLPDPIHAGVVQFLAGMVLRGLGETHS